MKPSSEIGSSDPDHNNGVLRLTMVSTEGDGCSTVTSAQPLGHHQESRNKGKSPKIIESSSSHIKMASKAGDECSTASSSKPQQNVPSYYQGKKDKLSEIHQSSNSRVIELGSTVAGDDPAVSSAQAQEYCREEDRRRYQNLYEATKKGNWKVAKSILDSRRDLVRADLTNRKETILHVATQSNRASFVRLLLEYLDDDERKECLESTDAYKNTAFLFAVASGNVDVVDIMGQKNPELRIKTGHHDQLTPLHIAALQEKSEMAWHLYEKTVGHKYDDLKSLLFFYVNAEIYDLALELLKKTSDLTFEKDDEDMTVLHILARKPLGLKKTQQHELVRHVWNEIFLGSLNDRQIVEKVRGPPHVVFDAVKVGNFEFLALLISTYPYLIWEVDEEKRSIIHIAVLNRQADIFSFTRDYLDSVKDIIVRYKDKSGSNLLHMAATLSSKDQPKLLFGEAFQMTLELLWFEVVKKILPPSFIEHRDANNFTPHELFTRQHEQLVEKAQAWTDKTTNCCMVVSTFITTGVFTATFSILGGIKDETGSPHYLVDEKKWFMIFSIFDAFAMISSSTSLFIFFSILISRHAEYDFQYKSLPVKLIFGLLTLLFSITSMMISFSSAFIMYFNAKTPSNDPHHSGLSPHNNGLKWASIVIFVLALIPIPVFVYLVWPLWSDISKLTKFSWHLSKPRKNVLQFKST